MRKRSRTSHAATVTYVFSGWCFPEMEVDCWWFITH